MNGKYRNEMFGVMLNDYYNKRQAEPKWDLELIRKGMEEARGKLSWDFENDLNEINGVWKKGKESEIFSIMPAIYEALASSGIEGIYSNVKYLCNALIGLRGTDSDTKLVLQNMTALNKGYELLGGNKKKFSVDIINKIQSELLGTEEGIRKKGVVIMNTSTGQVIYTPPKKHKDIVNLMDGLVTYINAEQEIVYPKKLGILHHEFESIHPYHDGNGRTGRILNILYMVSSGLIYAPIISPSVYILKNRPRYYKLLNSVRTDNTCEEWVEFLWDAMEKSIADTRKLMNVINELYEEYYKLLQYSGEDKPKEFIKHIFMFPHTTPYFMAKDLSIPIEKATSVIKSMAKTHTLVKTEWQGIELFMNGELLSTSNLIFSK